VQIVEDVVEVERLGVVEVEVITVDDFVTEAAFPSIN